jgi:hypothetical protein
MGLADPDRTHHLKAQGEGFSYARIVTDLQQFAKTEKSLISLHIV